jgi:hypothetical protein
MLELPDAPPQPYVAAVAGASCGKVTAHEITSKILEEHRTYSGGLMAAYVALNHPDVFGNVMSQSGAFWIYPGALDTLPALSNGNTTLMIEALLNSPCLPVRFYLDAGRFEDGVPHSLLVARTANFATYCGQRGTT